MAAHLAHKIPWESLCAFLISRRNAGSRRQLTPAENKTLVHIGRVITQSLCEFKTTAKTTSNELAVLNAKTWHISEQSSGGYTGYYDSLLWGYVELNMLLADPQRIAPLLRTDQGGCSFIISLLLGDHDGGHPPVIADQLMPAFDGFQLKPLTADVMQTLRDHAALLFRCMYIMLGDNKLLDEQQTVERLFSYFACTPTVE